MLVSYGNASGAVESFAPGILAQKGSLYLTRPTLFNYVATREELLDASQTLFDVVASGAVKIEVNQTYPLEEAGRAHDDLTGRKTTGSTVLLP
jgi:NADPH2:quinone reductase